MPPSPNAPKFFEIAKEIVELTENKTIVAHNASFDYNFIRNEFKSLGFDYKRETLCTVRLSRKLLPGKRSYSLGNCEIAHDHLLGSPFLFCVGLSRLRVVPPASSEKFVVWGRPRSALIDDRGQEGHQK